jgi:dienelactone hydrolase
MPDARPRAFSEWTIQACKDLCRSLDYLETRRDIDTNRLAYFGSSAGAAFGTIVLAVENRFKAAILLSGGIPASAASDVASQIPALDPLHHAPRIETPVLMINGETDPIFPVETSQRPLFRLLGKRTADLPKKHQLYPGGHGLLGLFGKQIQEDIRDWLDRHLGPVE